MKLLLAVFDENEDVVVFNGPFDDDEAANRWVIDNFPGMPSWQTIRMVSPGETVILECGHRIVSTGLNPDIIQCQSCSTYQPVLHLDRG